MGERPPPTPLHPVEALTLSPSEGLARVSPSVPLANPAIVYHDAKDEGSRPAIRAVLNRIAAWLVGAERALSWEKTTLIPWWEVRARHVALVRAKLIETSAPRTVNRDLSILRNVLRIAWENEQMTTDQYQHARGVRGVDKDKSKAGRALSVEELRALVRAARELAAGDPPDARPLAALALMYGAGLRRAEVVGVRVENLDLDHARLALVGKRRKRRVAYLAPGWADLIRTWSKSRPASGPLFDVRAPESVWRWVAELRERAAVAPFTPHDLRRSFGTHLLALGNDLALVRDLMGHDDVRTTMLYDRRGESEMQKGIEVLPHPDRDE